MPTPVSTFSQLTVTVNFLGRGIVHENGKADDFQPIPDPPEEEEEKKKEVQSVGILELFSFADKWDVFWICLGIFGAVGAGAVFPIMFAVFGDLTDAFNSYSIQHEFANCDENCFANSTNAELCQEIDDTIKDAMVEVLWKMCTLGVSMWLAQYLLTVALQTSAMRQVARIRTKG